MTKGREARVLLYEANEKLQEVHSGYKEKGLVTKNSDKAYEVLTSALRKAIASAGTLKQKEAVDYNTASFIGQQGMYVDTKLNVWVQEKGYDTILQYMRHVGIRLGSLQDGETKNMTLYALIKGIQGIVTKLEFKLESLSRSDSQDTRALLEQEYYYYLRMATGITKLIGV